jgi:copper oxidase (laccase) domain-containing protein
MLDLKGVARRLLERAGVTAVEDSGICTRCEGETFFSHRGEGPETGRQAGIVTAA